MVLWFTGCTRSNPTPIPEDKYYLGGEAKAPAGVANTPLPKVELAAVPLVEAAALSEDSSRVAVKFLVITTDKTDLLLPALEERLKELGAAYDVLLSADQALTQEVLLNPEGTGKYNAIVLTSNSLFYRNPEGNFVAGLSDAEWNLLWQYEREYKVRQVSLFTAPGVPLPNSSIPGVYPEEYCLRAGGELGQPIGSPAYPLSLTAEGHGVFSYLRAEAQVPVVNSFLYLPTLAADCKASAIPLFKDKDGTVLGLLSTSEDGRERLALTFNQNANLLHSQMIGYGLLHWASRGLFFGERRMFLNVDVDDWFIPTAWRKTDGTSDLCGYRMDIVDASSVPMQQKKLRQQFPLASGFTLNLAFVGRGVDVENLKVSNGSNQTCFSALSNPDPLVEYTRQIKNEFRWINHTYTHILPLDKKNQALIEPDIEDNRQIAKQLGLDSLPEMIKTPELSGLGYFNAEGTLFGPKTDFGLEQSNPAFLAAAKAKGITVVHANMSVPSQRPICFNCGIYHPVEPSIFLIPVWPNSVAFSVTTPAEATLFYNSVYGPGGSSPQFPRDLTYEEWQEVDADVALRHVVTGNIYSHYMHQGNLREYSVERSLVFDWTSKVVEQYTRYYQTPLRNVSWRTIINYTATRNTHFNTLRAGMYAVVDRKANKVIIDSPQAGQVFMTGLAPDISADLRGQQVYGGDVISRIQVKGGSRIELKLGKGVGAAAVLAGPEGDW
jgi:hypothetical protein